MNRALLALAPAILLLSACSAPAASPTVDPEPTVLEVPAIDGDWVMTRTVTADTNGEFAVGLVETRYLVFAAPTCDESTCTGTVNTSGSEDIFSDLGTNAAAAEYSWDGTSLAYAFDPLPIDCSDDTGKVLVSGLYTSAVEYELELSDGDAVSAAAFGGAATQTIEMVGDPGDTACPSGDVVDYDAQLARH